MKTTILFFAIMIAATITGAQLPCPTDSVGGGGAGVGFVDSLVIGTIESRCTPCPTEGVVGWSIPQDFNGNVTIYSPQIGHVFALQVVRSCRYVMFDTCGVFDPDPAMNQFVVQFATVGNAAVYVSADIGDTIIVICKSTPTPQEELAPFLDLATCSIPMGITPRIEPIKRYWEFDGYYWRQVTDRPTRGWWKEL